MTDKKTHPASLSSEAQTADLKRQDDPYDDAARGDCIEPVVDGDALKALSRLLQSYKIMLNNLELCEPKNLDGTKTMPPWLRDCRLDLQKEKTIRSALYRGECAVPDGLIDDLNRAKEHLHDPYPIGDSRREGAVIAINTALKKLSAAPKVDKGWRDISSAPKDGTFVDLWWRAGRKKNCVYDEKSGLWLDDRSMTVNEPFYWMPLPPKPTEGE